MTTPLAFVPRVVETHPKPWYGISRPPPSPSPPPDPTTDNDDSDSDSEDNITANLKGKEKAVAHSKLTQDIASLVSLALSDYNIWFDADLRWKLDACLNDETSPEEAGFVPINYILRRAPFRGSLPLSSGEPEPSETQVVKALRTHASRTLEVRMCLPAASSVWYGTGKTSRKKDVGGYEVRRRDWPTLRHRPSRGWARARWDDLTAYMEGIPPQYRTVGGIARFTEMLLPEPGTGAEPRTYVQNITLPPHYLDKPRDTPKCKGYALVTFSTKSHLETVIHAWPWKRRHEPEAPHERGDKDENTSPTVKEARKYGLRTISKARWNTLNEEYLQYKQHLVDEMARMQSGAGQSTTQIERAEPADVDAQPETQVKTTLTSPYPFGCLVFVRNVHPETNKTTLKSLFNKPFEEEGCLDYVDFTKGMDTCYLRLTSPHHAARLIAEFGAQRKVQADGLDAVGRLPVGNDKPIAMELVQGKKEELYWDKVPEKVRGQAVDKAVNAERGMGVEPSVSTQRNGVHSSGRKKRPREP